MAYLISQWHSLLTATKHQGLFTGRPMHLYFYVISVSWRQESVDASLAKFKVSLKMYPLSPKIPLKFTE